MGKHKTLNAISAFEFNGPEISDGTMVCNIFTSKYLYGMQQPIPGEDRLHAARQSPIAS